MPAGPAAHVAHKETHAGEPKLRERGVMAIGSASDGRLDPPLYSCDDSEGEREQGNTIPRNCRVGIY